MSILSSMQYDLGSICDTGDVGVAVTYYAVTQLPVDTHVILTKELSTSDEGMVLGSFLSAIIQKSDVTSPERNDWFRDVSTLTDYKVLEIISHEDAFCKAVVEII